MASRFKRISGNLNIDDSLTSEGADSELSLADDTDEFSESFSGTLTISLSQSFHDENSKRRLLRQGFSDDSADGIAIPFTSADEPESKPLPARVCFEIVNAKIVKEGRNKYVLYSILVTRPGVDPSQAVIDRRYSDFDHLHTSLKKLYPNLMTDISFPTKKVTGNFKAETIAQRSRAFEQYLTHVHSIDILRLSPEFASFFYENDLDKAYKHLQEGRYKDCIPILKSAALMQQKLLGDKNPNVISTLCSIVAVAGVAEQDKLAQAFAEVAIQYIGDDGENEYLIPLLQTSIRLCWKLGKDKKDLEAKLQHLRDAGMQTDNAPLLLDLVMTRNRRR